VGVGQRREEMRRDAVEEDEDESQTRRQAPSRRVKDRGRAGP
jgi:hypothetical protein